MTGQLTRTELIELHRSLPMIPEGTQRSLVDRFIVPPFSVLDARQGYWQDRKRMWYATGLIRAKFGSDADHTSASDNAEKLVGGYGKTNRLAPGGTGANTCWKDYNGKDSSGTSIFDPVLCEVVLRWFCPKGGKVLDPFAGGTSLGVVAGKLGYDFTGVEVRSDQVDANNALASEHLPSVRWVCEDSSFICKDTFGAKLFDLVFTDPPYFTLERYSNRHDDGSTKRDYSTFFAWYSEILKRSASVLTDDRFFVLKIGEVRDQDGAYCNFVGDTISLMRRIGLHFYNDAVLITAVGSLPIRIGTQFPKYRKLGKTHQNVLVFVKGDPARAAATCGEVDVYDLEMPDPVLDSVAVCVQDCADLLASSIIYDAGTEVVVLPMPRVDACLYADILRGQARTAGCPIPRIWICRDGAWCQVDESIYLTYLIGDDVYLNRKVFADAPIPMGNRPTVTSLYDQ